ncbi:MAG: LysE family translocator [Pseudomonadota bacterium]
MVDPLLFAAFIPAALALNLTPGADMLFCLGQGIRRGTAAAWAASAGVALGGIVHVCIAGAGLSAILMNWPVTFDVIRWIGVGYLLWLAWAALRRDRDERVAPKVQARNAFWSGLWVNLSNPKVILFVLAFVPQFVSPNAGPVFLQFLLFGSVIALGVFIINGLVGVGAGVFGHRLARGSRVLDYVTASLFTALAVRLALLERSGP